METLGSLECFVRSAEAGSFAGAARRLGMTPAAVGKNVVHRAFPGKAALIFRKK
jgi:hypothetical protein